MIQYPRLEKGLSLIAPFLFGVKLSFAYIALFPLLIIAIPRRIQKLRERVHQQPFIYYPLIAFVGFCFYSALFGVNPLQSFRYALKFSALFLIIPLMAEQGEEGRTSTILTALILGLCCASLHTIIEGAYPDILFQYGYGPVTEAGQLGVGIFGAFALFLTSRENSHNIHIHRELFVGTASFFAFLVLGFSAALDLYPLSRGILLAVSLLFICCHLLQLLKSSGSDKKISVLLLFLLRVALPLLAAALIVNLKRGPWLGVVSGLVIFLGMVRPKLLLLFFPLTALIIFGFEPVQSRLFASIDHFLMVGGRGDMWRLGFELLIRYPLGIGLDNSSVIRDFSHDIPDTLNHFHNNILNIGVETGWLGLIAYICWMGSVVLSGLGWPRDGKETRSLSTLALACGIISWQIAGLVEYNFGDSEVLIVALVLLGLASAQPLHQQKVRNY